MYVRRIAWTLLGTVIFLAVPTFVAADNPGIGQVIVPGDHVLPGGTFQITGYDLDPSAQLAFKLTSGTTSIDLGTSRVAADGTVAMTVTLPQSFPLGYAKVLATSDGGGQWSTSVLIGERAEGPGSQVVADDGSVGRLAALAVLAVGVVIFLAAGARYRRR